MSKIHNFTGIIICKRKFMESDLIVTVLNKNGLRHEFIAKGADNGNSKRKSHLEAMCLVGGTYYQGRSHEYLQTVEVKSGYRTLKTDLERVLRMHLILEIIEKTVMRDDPHPEIFTLLLETLEEMDKKDSPLLNVEISLTKLAHLLGYLPNFKECSSCHKALHEDTALWNAEEGTISCKNCGNEEHSHIPLKYRKALEFFRSSSQKDTSRIKIREEEHRTLQEFLPQLFSSQIGQPLKSLTLLFPVSANKPIPFKTG